MNIRSFHLETHGEISEGIVMLYVTNTNLLNKVISEIRKIDGITKVYRINSYDNTSEQIS